jgi:hypothetical protein
MKKIERDKREERNEIVASKIMRGGHQDITLGKEVENQKYTHVERSIRRVSKGYNVLRIASFKKADRNQKRERER